MPAGYLPRKHHQVSDRRNIRSAPHADNEISDFVDISPRVGGGRFHLVHAREPAALDSGRDRRLGSRRPIWASGSASACHPYWGMKCHFCQVPDNRPAKPEVAYYLDECNPFAFVRGLGTALIVLTKIWAIGLSVRFFKTTIAIVRCVAGR
jgi:hypothetical protein